MSANIRLEKIEVHFALLCRFEEVESRLGVKKDDDEDDGSDIEF